MWDESIILMTFVHPLLLLDNIMPALGPKPEARG